MAIELKDTDAQRQRLGDALAEWAMREIHRGYSIAESGDSSFNGVSFDEFLVEGTTAEETARALVAKARPYDIELDRSPKTHSLVWRVTPEIAFFDGVLPKWRGYMRLCFVSKY